jgi:glucose/arabinose dehydrogenase
VILTVDQPFVNHNGGQIAFGPEGYYLYIGMGDGGSARDPMGNGQNLGALLGKILRIDVNWNRAGGDRAYGVPADNPFVGQSGARSEVWAYGLRNPWRFSFDSQTGQLWIADVGQNSREEIDIGQKGGNYGWNVMEGLNCLSGSSCDRSGKVLPVIDYPTGADCAVTGGYVYRGGEMPGLVGAYIYGDYCSGRIWGLRYDGAQVTEQRLLLDSSLLLSSFGVDPRGELYAVDHNDGGLYRLVQA